MHNGGDNDTDEIVTIRDILCRHCVHLEISPDNGADVKKTSARLDFDNLSFAAIPYLADRSKPLR